MDNKIEVVEDALIVLGVAISIDMIKSILGIVLLSLQVLLILYKGIRMIIKHVKDKNYDECVEVIDQMTKDIHDAIDRNTEDGKSNDSK